MGTLTPKIGLDKPTPNVSTDWAFTLNSDLDILDDTLLVANLSGAGTVTVSGDGSGNVTVSGAPRRLLTSTAIDLPDQEEDVTLFRATSTVILTELFSVVRGAGTPSVTWTVRHDANRNSGSGTEVVTAGTTTTSKTSGQITSTLDNPTITGGEWIWLETTVTGGDPQELTVQLFA